MNRISATLFLALAATATASAQRFPVIADMDTRLPLSGAIVSTSGGQRLTTDYTGHFHSSLPINSATISKKHYMQRRIGTAELQQDTVFLLPQAVVLDEVVVSTPGFSFDTQKALREIKENAALPNPNQGFNLLGIFSALFPSKAKTQTRADKIKKILEKY